MSARSYYRLELAIALLETFAEPGAFGDPLASDTCECARKYVLDMPEISRLYLDLLTSHELVDVLAPYGSRLLDLTLQTAGDGLATLAAAIWKNFPKGRIESPEEDNFRVCADLVSALGPAAASWTVAISLKTISLIPSLVLAETVPTCESAGNCQAIHLVASSLSGTAASSPSFHRFLRFHHQLRK